MTEKVLGRTCDGCTMCCKLLGVQADEGDDAFGFKKPGEWCRECDIGKGCKIYDRRPISCRAFACLWVLGAFPDDMRPDRIKAVFFQPPAYDDPNDRRAWVQVNVDPGRKWREGKLGKWIELIRDKGVNVVVVQGERRLFLQGDGAEMPDKLEGVLLPSEGDY